MFENHRVRVLEHVDAPGARTSPHDDLHSVSITLSSSRRRLHVGKVQRDVELCAGAAHWLPAQRHAGENTGDTATHTIFVELEDPAGAAPSADQGALGPQVGRPAGGSPSRT